MHSLWASFVTLCLLTKAVLTKPGEVKYDGKCVQGDVLVPCVESLVKKEGTFWNGITSAEDCAKYCSALPGCNAYTYCGNNKGCPGDCSKVIDRGHKVGLLANTSPNITRLPLSGVGPYFRGCVVDSATKRSWWPQGTCTLVNVTDPQTPKFYEEGEGWHSGVFNQTRLCGRDVSPAACSRCLASKDKAGCLRCARRKPVAPKDVLTRWDLGITGTGFYDTAQEQCGICAALNSTRARRQCSDCLLTKSPCAKCADPLLNTAACVACTNQTHNFTVCSHCTQAPSAQARQMCVNCYLKDRPCQQCSPLGSLLQDKDIVPCVECTESTGLSRACYNCIEFPEGPVRGCVQCVARLSQRFCKNPNVEEDKSCIPQSILICQECAKRGQKHEECVQCSQQLPFNYQKCTGSP